MYCVVCHTVRREFKTTVDFFFLLKKEKVYQKEKSTQRRGNPSPRPLSLEFRHLGMATAALRLCDLTDTVCSRNHNLIWG